MQLVQLVVDVYAVSREPLGALLECIDVFLLYLTFTRVGAPRELGGLDSTLPLDREAFGSLKEEGEVMGGGEEGGRVLTSPPSGESLSLRILKYASRSRSSLKVDAT